ncbi:Crp/Fnr family transcriptional regulator [Methylomagnum sp.]
MADATLWAQYFPDFAARAEPPVERLKTVAKLVRLSADQTVFQPGSPCGNYLLVLEGCVRVRIFTPSGREVLLYQVRRGGACILTTSCLLGGNDYPAEGITESPVTALAVPAAEFHQALNESTFFRAFVFAGFADRLTRVIVRMEELVEGDIDRMLAKALLASGTLDPVRKTHQALAADIGTAREVVSRHIKRFEERGWVRLGRGTVEIADAATLRGLAEGGKPGE